VAVTGPPEWRSTPFWTFFAGFWLLNGAFRLLVLTSVAVDLVLAALSIGLGGYAAICLVPHRVRADGTGLRVRGAGWRTTSVAWSEIADIRPRRPDRPGDPLVVVTLDGREVRTMLHPVTHRSLPRHWRAQAGLPEPEARSGL